MKKAAELAKVKEYYTQSYPGKTSWMDQFLASDNDKKGNYLDSQIQKELRALLGDMYEPFMQISNDLRNNNSLIQAKLLDDVRVK